MPPKRTRGGAAAPSQQPFHCRNSVDEAAVVAQLSVFGDLPTSALLAIVVGVSCRLQCAVAPLHAPVAADDRESSAAPKGGILPSLSAVALLSWLDRCEVQHGAGSRKATIR